MHRPGGYLLQGRNEVRKMDNRIYVAVDVRFLTDGSVVPREIIWSNGRTYGIDSVIETRRIRTLENKGIAKI